MALCGGKLWVGTANTQELANWSSITQGGEVWRLDNTTWTQVVGNRSGAEMPSGFDELLNWAMRSMIEYPKDSGQLIVGTYSDQTYTNPPEACEIWIRYP